MATKPTLVQIGETEYGCSLGDFKIEAVKPKALSEAEWQRRRENQFAEHVRLRHSREDANQAASRIVRESTERD
jgi:hypothetical protein